MTRRDTLRRIETAIVRISRIGTGRQAARMRAERSGIDLPRPAIAVLATLAATEHLRVTDLAERTDHELALVSREVRDLDARGYVRRSPDPHDGRASLVALTPKGRRAYEAHRQATDDIITECFAHWSAKDLATMAELLERAAADLAAVPRPTDAASR